MSDAKDVKDTKAKEPDVIPEHTVNGAFTIKGEDHLKVHTLMTRVLTLIEDEARKFDAHVTTSRVDFTAHEGRKTRPV